MNKVSNIVLYHDFMHSLNKHNVDDMIGNIKEYICGDTLMKAADLACLESNIGEVKRHLAEAGIDNASVETYVGEQGNICFFTKLLVEGVDYLAIPLKIAEDVQMFICPDKLSMDASSNIVLVEACDMSAHLLKLKEECDEDEFDQLKTIHDILKRIPEDTLLRMIDPETYENKLRDTFGSEFGGFPKEASQSGFGMYLSGKGNNDISGLFYDVLGPDLAGRSVFDDAEGSQLVCCNNENYREFLIFGEDESQDTDTIEEYYLVDIASNIRFIESNIAEANIAREVRKQTIDKANPDKVGRDISKAVDTDRGVRSAAALPATFAKRVKELNRGLRGFVGNWRRSHDDSLREKLYNDEYIPLIDDIFEILISGATAYGLVAVGLCGPLAAAVIGIGVFLFANWRQKEDRKRIIELLDDKIKLLEEEIEDSKLDSDLVTKRQLIQIKTQLERKRAKITVGNSLGSR